MLYAQRTTFELWNWIELGIEDSRFYDNWSTWDYHINEKWISQSAAGCFFLCMGIPTKFVLATRFGITEEQPLTCWLRADFLFFVLTLNDSDRFTVWRFWYLIVRWTLFSLFSVTLFELCFYRIEYTTSLISELKEPRKRKLHHLQIQPKLYRRFVVTVL